MTVKIISDSTSDLPAELASKYDIEIVPLHILLGDASYDDGRNLTPDDIFSWSDQHNATPTTSAPSLMEVMKVFERFYKEYDQMVCFTISSTMSSSFNVFRLAAQEMEISDRVFIIDSQNLCTGIALMIIKAAEMARDGKNGEEIYYEICNMRSKIRTSFVIDTLTYLHRGGRCSSVAAIAGGALKLHPMIVVEDGKMHSSRKYRGNMSRVYQTYAQDLRDQLSNACTDRIILTHSGCSREDIGAVYDILKNEYDFSEILIARAGGVISSHCGPNAMGIMFAEK